MNSLMAGSLRSPTSYCKDSMTLSSSSLHGSTSRLSGCLGLLDRPSCLKFAPVFMPQSEMKHQDFIGPPINPSIRHHIWVCQHAFDIFGICLHN